MNKVLSGIFAFCLLFSVFSCKKETAPVASAPSKAALKADVLNTEFTTFSAKGRMQLETADNNLASGVTIRMKKDSVIWVSMVPGLGIEVARVFITPDTIMILDRLHQQYFTGNFDMLKKRYNMAVTFDLVQGLLVGNYVPGSAEKEIASGELRQLQYSRDNLQVNQFLDTNQKKLKRLQVTDTKTSDAVNVTYNEFETLEGKPFPTAFLMLLDRVSATNPKSKNASVAVKYSKYAINEAGMSFPFSIPAGYERK